MHGELTTNLSPKIKKRPRGKPFEKGNTLSLPYRFPKGVSGNPGGRPKSREVNASCREWFASDIGHSPKVQTNAEAVVAKIGLKAKKGDINAATFLSERAEGKPAVAVAVNGGGGQLLEFFNQEMNRRAEITGPPEGYDQEEIDERRASNTLLLEEGEDA